MQTKTDEIFFQWNDILNEHLTPTASDSVGYHHDRLIKWLENRLSETLSQPVNSSDKFDLQLRMAYTQVVSREVAKVSEILKESKIQQNKNSSRRCSTAELQSKVSHHSNSLMKLKDELAQKLKQLDRLKVLLSEATESVDEFFKMIDLISSSEKSEEEESLNMMRLRVDQKSSLVSELSTLYYKIQTDVEENHFTMNDEISKQMKGFEDKWGKLKLKCKSIGVHLRSTAIYGPGTKSSRLIGDISHEFGGFSPVSQISSASCDTEAIITSRTTYSNSQSSFLSEEVVPSINNQNDEHTIMANTLLHDIKHCLNAILFLFCDYLNVCLFARRLSFE